MRVGVYVDGYNLYYGGRSICGNQVSWKWLSPRLLTESVLQGQAAYARTQGWSQVTSVWGPAIIHRIVYCTARVDGAQNPSAHADQDVYLKALHAAAAVDHIAFGNYVSRVKSAPLATKDPASRKPVLATSKPPVRVKDSHGQDVPDALFMVSYLHNEEKGTDVNLASHLLIDVTTGAIDAAIVISNDSDLGFPIRWARSQLPVAVVNPRGGPTAGDLQPNHAGGAGPHWNRELRVQDFLSAQMPDPVAHYARPSGW